MELKYIPDGQRPLPGYKLAYQMTLEGQRLNPRYTSFKKSEERKYVQTSLPIITLDDYV